MTLSDIIIAKGLKKEYLIDRCNINRNKFYKGLKEPATFSPTELERIALVLNVKVETLKDLIK
jgi:hypothetical protein